MDCRNCSYCKEDFERRMNWYEETVEEQGVPNNTFDYLEPENAEEEFEQFLWCEKVGGKVYCFGHCEDAYSDVPEDEETPRRNKINKRERHLRKERKLRKIVENSYGYPQSAMYIDKVYVKGYGYVENPKPYYKRLYRGKSSSYHKKMSNKAIRRYKGELSNGQMCHKLYDFWWAYC